jgi:hypothetical protein
MNLVAVLGVPFLGGLRGQSKYGVEPAKYM